MRLNNLANEDFAQQRAMGRIRSDVPQADRHERNQGNVDGQVRGRARSRRSTRATSRQYGYIDQPKNKLRVPMHLRAEERPGEPPGHRAAAAGKVRMFQDDGRGSTAFLGEDWGKFTPLDDEMRLFVGVAQDIAVQRTIEKNELHRVAGNLYDIEVIVKYEIENFKDQAVTLDIAESLRDIRDGRVSRHRPRRAMGTRRTDHLRRWRGPSTRARGTRKLFHAQLPARGADSKAAKIVHKLHFTIKNEW